MNPIHSFYRLAGLLLLVFSVSSCAVVVLGAAAAGAGVAGTKFVNGGLKVDVLARPNQVARAAEQALMALRMHEVSSSATVVDGYVDAVTADDKRIKIVVKRRTDDISRLSIRVGTFGDQQTSQLIYDQMRQHLPRQATNLQ
ncbi:MAG: DUF3568 family protein [Legionellales bacterium]|nr:DUF3568 family protein [Legionellales bacterium]